MSTKTSIKRIALVAVSALGFGLLSVIPANAAFTKSVTDGDPDAVGTVALTQMTTGRLDAPVIVKLTSTVTSTATGDGALFVARFSGSVPGGSTLDGDDITWYESGVRGANAGELYTGYCLDADTGDEESGCAFDGTLTGDAGDDGYKALDVDSGATAADTRTVVNYLKFTPNKVGTWNLQVWNDADNGEDLDSGENTRTLSITVTDKAISTISVTAASTAPALDNANTTANLDDINTLVKICLKDSASAAIMPISTETIAVSVNGSGFFDDINMANGTYGSDVSGAPTSLTLVATNFNEVGCAWVEVGNATAATVTVTATVDGGAATGTGNVTTVASAGNLADEYRANAATPTGYVMATDNVTVSNAATSITLIGETASLELKTATLVTDTDGVITGLPGAKYLVALTAGASNNTLITAPAVSLTLSGMSWPFVGATISIEGDGQDAQTLTSAASAVSASLSLFNIDAITATSGAAITVTVNTKDQFSANKAGLLAAFSVAGRNTVTTGTNVITDASGNATFTYTDAGTSGSDTISVTVGGTAITDTVTVTYDAANAVSTVTVTGGNTDAGVTATTVVRKDIAAGTAGAAANKHALTATVKNAAGTLLTGVPVTFTVTGTGAAIPSNVITVYTNTSGVATSSVYGWLAGTYTYTATAGAVSGTGTITLAQTAAGEERKITATVSGPIVTAKVVDRFGNPVPLVTVYATKTGVGYFGDGKLKTSGTTDTNGEISFAITGGDAEVTVATYDMSDVTAKGSGQTCSRAGTASCSDAAADDTAFTARTTGTTITAETGVGNDVAAYTVAGVASAKVAVTGVNTAQAAAEAASDAAAEAIDAANAATDAANLAAEAADAATVAAEEARDAADAATAAVEELATQVATLMAALKAQITTLANTVAKIAKKVKA